MAGLSIGLPSHYFLRRPFYGIVKPRFLIQIKAGGETRGRPAGNGKGSPGMAGRRPADLQ
jgi:hypothetical protein